MCCGIWHYSYAIYYLVFQRIEKTEALKVASVTTQLRIFDVLQHHQDKTYGIDVSHYQGKIEWDKVSKLQDSFPISFVFSRATAGSVKVDRRFKKIGNNLKQKVLYVERIITIGQMRIRYYRQIIL